jgi:anti-anti-sigma factor
VNLDDARRPASPDPLVVTPRRHGDRAVLEIAGELDLDSRTWLSTTAHSILEKPPRPAHLELDAVGIEFIDSGGLNTLLEIRERASRAGVTFQVTKASSQFRRVVDLAGLDNILSIST